MGILILDNFITYLSDTLDVSLSQMTFVVCMLLSYPIGYANRYVVHIKSRLWIGVIFGMLLQFQMYGQDIIHVIIDTFTTFLFIKFLGRKVSPFYVLTYNILHLSYLHWRIIMGSFGNWSLGIEALYMMSICKFSSIAFNYEDGGKTEEEMKYSYYKKNAIYEKPTLLETFSYVFYFPTSLVGPSYEFSDFIRFIRLEKEYKNIQWSKCNKSAITNILCAYVFGYILVGYAKQTDPSYCGTEEYANKSVLYKIFYVYFSLIVTRSKYYVGWKLGQGSIDFCGLGYTVKLNEDGKEEISFEKIDCCNVTVMEWSLNPRIKIQYWNRSVHLWLKYYLYLRLVNIKTFEKKKWVASLMTFLVSALWHGFYPAYYLFFIHFFFIEQIAAFAEENFDIFNKVEKMNIIVRIIFWQAVMIPMFYYGQSFTLLHVTTVYNYYKAFCFVPNILIVLVFIYIRFIYKKKRKDLKKDI